MKCNEQGMINNENSLWKSFKLKFGAEFGITVFLQQYLKILQAKLVQRNRLRLLKKLLDQQKRNPIVLPSTNDELKSSKYDSRYTNSKFSCCTTRTFSRFVQAIFQPHAS